MHINEIKGIKEEKKKKRKLKTKREIDIMTIKYFFGLLLLISLFDNSTLKCIQKQTYNKNKLNYILLDGKYGNIYL